MERMEKQSVWDAKRLIQEYLKKADLIKHYQEKPFEDIAWSNQIRIKRIASALRAFMGMKGVEEKPIDLITSVFDGWEFSRLLEYSPLSEDDSVSLHTLLKDAIADDHQYESLMCMSDSRRDEYPPEYMDREKYRDRRFMLHVLFDYRKSAEKLISHFDGVMEGTVGAYLGILAVKGACVTPLKHNNEKIDDILALLLGDKFKQSFTEGELKNDYGYPKETDDELFEWDCDNW